MAPPSAASDAPVRIEDDLPRHRVRRPTDPLRLLIALMLTGTAIGIGVLATRTSEGLDRDVASATRELPSLIVLALNVVGAGAVFLLPAGIAVVLVLRRRTSQLFESLLGALLAAGATVGVGLLIAEVGSTRLALALTGAPGVEVTTAINPLLAALVAFITVSRMIELPPWNAISVLTVLALGGAILVAGGTSVLAVIAAISLGWAAGLIIRYALGTPSTMPSAEAIVATLRAAGVAVFEITALAVIPEGRRYLARSPGGDVDVTVLDREREGAGLGATVTSLHLRTERPSRFGVRRRLEHDTALLLTATAAGARVPMLRAARECGPEAAVIAQERCPGRRLDTLVNAAGRLPPGLADPVVVDVLTQVMALQRAGIAHRSITAHHLLLADPPVGPGAEPPSGTPPDSGAEPPSGTPPDPAAEGAPRVVLLAVQGGVLAASDLTLRLDLAEALITVSALAGASRAVQLAHQVCGEAALLRALPALQPVAMSAVTRRLLRRETALLGELRTALTELVQVTEVPTLNLQRIRPRTVIALGLSAIALYVLVPQLTRIDLGQIVANARPEWALIALAFSALTYVAATTCLLAFVPTTVNYLRALLVQFAASFIVLFSPPTVGTVAINVRFLQRSTIPAPVAGLTVVISQLMSFLSHVLLLSAVLLVAGTQAELSVRPPRFALVAVAAGLIGVGVVATLSPVRRWTLTRVRPVFAQIGPALAAIAGNPRRLLIGLSGGLALNICYIGALYASVLAFDGPLNLTAVAFVYLAGMVLGQLVPTPGGLGAVEAALAAGLTAVGLDGATAISSVLLFRLVTFWIPILPGWASFLWLQRRAAI